MFAKENSSVVDNRGKKGKDVPLRKSDRKNLRKRVEESLALPDETNEIIEAIFMKGQLVSRNLILSDSIATLYIRHPGDGDSIWPYKKSAQVVWMELDEGPKDPPRQIPTLALLSAIAANPTILVPPEVSKYICRGADLMKAGMRSLPNPIPSDGVVQVAVKGNPQPFAVGILANSIHSIEDIGIGKQGIGVHIISSYGDDIWRQQVSSDADGDGIVSPVGGAPFDDNHYGNIGFEEGKFVFPIVKEEGAESEDSPDGAANEVTVNKNEENPSIQEQAETEHEAIPTLSQEEILHLAVCKGLASLSVKDLPMPISTFYGNHVLPNRPEGTTISLKDSKYKKFGAYVKEKVAEGLLQVGPDSSKKDPMAMLTGFHNRDDTVRDMKAEIRDQSPPSEEKKLLLVDLFRLPNNFESLLRIDSDTVKGANATSEERRNTGLLTSKEVQKILNDYLDRENLSDRGTITLDGPLTDALFKKDAEQAPQKMKRQDVVKAWLARMSKGFAIVEMPGSRITKLGNGKPPQILMEVSRRGGNKFVTRVRGLEDFGIDATAFATEVSHRFACSSSVDEEAEGRAALRKGYVELEFQGNLVNELEALLTNNEKLTSHGGARNSPYNLPKNCIEVVLRKGVPARKK